MKNNTEEKSLKEYVLTNVRLEEGFNYGNNNEVTDTKTSLFDIHINEGKIKKIAVKGGLDKMGQKPIDAKNFLMLPQ